MLWYHQSRKGSKCKERLCTYYIVNKLNILKLKSCGESSYNIYEVYIIYLRALASPVVPTKSLPAGKMQTNEAGWN